MADTLLVRQLSAHCRLGVTKAEQASLQTIWIDLELEIDAAKVAARDNVKDAVDYAALAAAVKEFAQEHPYHLLETLAEGIAALILHECGVPQVLVRVTKKALPEIDSAAVEIIRSKS